MPPQPPSGNGKLTADKIRARMDDDFWDARPELNLIRRWAKARQASSWAVLGEVLAEVICCIPPFVQLPPVTGGNGTLNMLIASAGKSGAGKGVASATARAAVKYVSPEKDVERLPLGSGEGIPHAFGFVKYDKSADEYNLVRIAFTVLIEITEIDTLVALQSRMGSTLSPTLRQLYSGERLGFGYADVKKKIIIPPHTYRSCVIAGVQPGRGAVILNDTDGGFAQRWLWLPATDPRATNSSGADPKRLIWKMPEEIKDEYPWEPGQNPYLVQISLKAEEQIRKARLVSLRGESDDMESHKLYTRLKAAAGLALLHGQSEVYDEDWDLAGELIRVSDSVQSHVEDVLREKAAADNRAKGHSEGIRAAIAGDTAHKAAIVRISKKVIGYIPINGDWISSAKLKNQVAARDRDMLPEVLRDLVELGRVEADKVTYRGQTGLRYRLRVKG
jgi:hypothetical protein